MVKPIILKPISGLLNILTCITVTTFVLFLQDWFGNGDMYAFVFWTIPLAIGVAVSGSTFLNALRPTNIIFRLLFIAIVAVLISFGWLYAVFLILGPWMNAFSFPIFYLWTAGLFVQLFFLDRMIPKLPTSRRNILIGLLAFPVIVVGSVIGMYFLSFAWGYLNRPEKETFLIPADFKGEFRIVYGEKCGVSPRTEEGRRILEIPLDGVLIIQPEFEAGIIDNEYYLVDSTGQKTRLNSSFGSEGRRPGISMGGSGSFGGPMADGGFSSESDLAIEFTDFTVYNGDTTTLDDRQSFRLHQKFDSLSQALVDACRNATAKHAD